MLNVISYLIQENVFTYKTHVNYIITNDPNRGIMAKRRTKR
jgi:hypothetical protein